MSLEVAAKHLAAHGRGKDTELIHMDKGEIASLQQIAKANGGSLTINPQTGLPEAGFLSALLPMIAGAGLMMIPGMQAGAAGLIVGGLQTARTGSLSKGIMAGLGAYGGAGLAGSAGAAGASSVTPTVSTPIAPPPAPVIPSGVENFGPSASADAFSAMPTTPAITPSAGLPTAYQDYGPVGQYTGSSAPLPTSTGGMDVAGAQPPAQGISNAAPVSEQASVRAIDNATIPKDFNAMNASERAQAIRSGASFSNAADWAGANKYSALGAATSVAAGMQKDPLKPAEPDKDMGQRYQFTGGKYEPAPAPDVPTYDEMLYGGGNFGRQQKYFKQPTYSPISADEAKSMYHFAAGGPVEQMSNNSMMGVNTMYPMANISTASYGTPDQMAEGGISGSGNLDLSIPLDFGGANGGGGFGGAGANGYSAVGSGGGSQTGFTGQNNTAIGAKGGAGLLPLFNTGQTPFSDPVNTFPAPNNQPQGTGAFGGATDSLKGLAAIYAGQQTGNTSVQQSKYLNGAYIGNPANLMASGGMATGGLSDAQYNLGGYSDGGRLLRGPGDGVSDSIPAVIGKKQPARLADGEFVVPARIVSELGNGSTEAGARKLYAMLDRVQASRKRTVGKGKVAKNNRADKYLPA